MIHCFAPDADDNGGEDLHSLLLPAAGRRAVRSVSHGFMLSAFSPDVLKEHMKLVQLQ